MLSDNSTDRLPAPPLTEPAGVDGSAGTAAGPDTALVMIGMPADASRQWSLLLRAGLEKSGVVASSCTVDELPAAAGRWGNAQFLVVVEAPEDALAAALTRDAQEDPAACLRDWGAAATAVLRHVHRHRQRTVLLDAAELSLAPDAAFARLGAWLGLTLDMSSPRPPVSVDPLCLLLARQLAEQDVRTVSLFGELRASCLSVVEGEAASSAPAAASGLQSLRALVEARANRDALQVQVLGLSAEVTQRQARSARLDADLKHANAEVGRLQEAWQGAQREAAENLLQLQQTQERLEAVWLEQQALQQARADAELQQAQAHEQAQAQAARLHESWQLAQREAETLLLQLHQTQEELETTWLQLQERQTRADKTAADSLAAQALSAQAAAQFGEVMADLTQARQALQQSRHDADLRQTQAQAEAARLHESWQLAQRDAELLALQLHQTQEQLEAAWLERQALQGSLDKTAAELSTAQARLEQAASQAGQALADHARLAAELADARRAGDQREAARAAVAGELTQARQALEASQSARQFAEQTLAATRQELKLAQQQQAQTHERLAAETARGQTAQAELAQAQQDAALQLVQLHQVQEELLAHYLRLKAYESPVEPPDAESLPLLGDVVATPVRPFRSLAVTSVQEQPPHRHVELRLDHVHLPAGARDSLDVRLLEHAGKPGLALFRSAEEAPLGTWRTDGQEAGREFMLLIPSDDSSLPNLQRMATSEWQFIRRLVDGLAVALRTVEPVDPVWHTVAARLKKQLGQLPARLRYDDLRVQIAAAGAASDRPRMELWFVNLLYGSQELPSLTLQWSPGAPFSQQAASAPLVCLLGQDEPLDEPPIASWPLRDDGRLMASWVLPVGQGLAGDNARRYWRAMTADDRSFTLALLDALPAAADRLDAHAAPSGLNADQLRREAAALHKQARRTHFNLRLRQVVGRAFRR